MVCPYFILIYILLKTDGDNYIFICFLSTGLSYCLEVSAFPSHPHFLDHFLLNPYLRRAANVRKKISWHQPTKRLPSCLAAKLHCCLFPSLIPPKYSWLCKGPFLHHPPQGGSSCQPTVINTNFWTTVAPLLCWFILFLGWRRRVHANVSRAHCLFA